MKRYRLVVMACSVLTTLTGCLAPFLLEQAVTNALTEQLLLNIARSHEHHPVHFTKTPSITIAK